MGYIGQAPLAVGVTSSDINDGTITNDDIAADAAISMSKTALVDGTGVTLSTNTLSVDASQTQITALGTIGTGTWEATDIGVEHGGTGVSSFTDAGVLIGNGTGAVQATSAGTSGQVLTSNGAGVDPTFQDAATGFTRLSIDSTAAQNFTTGDFVSGYNSSGEITGLLKRSASAGRNWDVYGGGNVSSDVIIPDSTSTSDTLKNALNQYVGPLIHYLTGEDCILALYIKESDDYLYGRVGTIASNGATIWGTETAIVSSAFNVGISIASSWYVGRVALTPLESSVGSGKMMVSYVLSNTSSTTAVYHKILTIVGGTTRSITVGAEQTQSFAASYHSPASGIEGQSGSSEAVVICIRATLASYVAGVTISGDTITFGTATQMGAGSSSGGTWFDQRITGAYNATNDSYAVIYTDSATSPYLNICSFTQAGTTLTFQTAVSMATVLSDITVEASLYNSCAVALVWDTTNTRWVCHLNLPNSTSTNAPLKVTVAAFTEASVGTYAKVGNTLQISEEKITDSTNGLFAHQYSWNTSSTQGIRSLITSFSASGALGVGDTGVNRTHVVNNNDYTINPYLRYDSTDSAWYVHSFLRTTTFMGTTKYWPLHYKITFDGTDWTVVKATLIDSIDTNYAGSSWAEGISRTIYDPDNDWYIKFCYTRNFGRNVASYNATGNELFGEGFTYMVWDDADINDYAGLYMARSVDILGVAENTVSAGGTVTAHIGDQVVTGLSLPSAPTGKPLSRAAIGPDGTLVTYRTRVINYTDLWIGTAVNTTDLLFGNTTVAMP